MKYCPRCGAEYDEGYTHCGDCNVDLTDVKPENDPIKFEAEVLVYSAQNIIEASLIESVLAENNILFRSSQIKEMAFSAFIGTSPYTPTDFYVFESDEGRAGKLIGDALAEAGQIDFTTRDEDVFAPDDESGEQESSEDVDK